MKKRTVRIFAIALAALMVLSLLPLAAYAQETEAPEEIPGLAWDGEKYVEVYHVYNGIEPEEAELYLAGDCQNHAVYWRYCIYCHHSAAEDWYRDKAQIEEELKQLKKSDEKADVASMFVNKLAELDAAYKFDGPVGDHVWGEFETVTEATCGEDGLEVRTCSVCEATEDRVIPATGEHNFVDGVCTVCSAEDPNYVQPVEETTENGEPEQTENGTTEGTEGNTTEGNEGNTTEGTENGTTEGTENGTTEGTENGTTEGTENGTTPRVPRTAPPRAPRTAPPKAPRTAPPKAPRTAPPKVPRTVPPRAPRTASPRRLRTASPRRLRTASPRRLRTASPRRPRTASPRRQRTASPRRPRTASPRRLRMISPRPIPAKSTSHRLPHLRMWLTPSWMQPGDIWA